MVRNSLVSAGINVAPVPSGLRKRLPGFYPDRGLRPPHLLTGGGKGIRTPDLQLAKLPLYQLSYAPLVSAPVRNRTGGPDYSRSSDFVALNFLPMRQGGCGLGFGQSRANFPLALEGANYSR